MSMMRNLATQDVVWSMLQAIPAYERDTWIMVGMAIKAEFGDYGFSLFDHWSATAENYDLKSVKSVWKSFKKSGIGIGSLIKLAHDQGWSTEKPVQVSIPKQKPPPKAQADTSQYAQRIWLKANRSNHQWPGNHPYSIAKGIHWPAGTCRGQASGSIIGKLADCIIVPVRAHGIGIVQAVQCINTRGDKQTFGSLSGGYLLLGNTLDKSLIWYICEGWASAVSMVFHHQNGNGVCAVSFGKSNLERVAKLIAKYHHPNEIVIINEDDT